MTLHIIFVIVFYTLAVGSAFTTLQSSRRSASIHFQRQAFDYKQETNDELIHDIEIMEDEAKHRLHNLLQQMDDLDAYQKTNSIEHPEEPRTVAASSGIGEPKAKPKEREPSSVPKIHMENQSPRVLIDKKDDIRSSVRPQKENSKNKTSKKEHKQVDIIKARPLNLLEGTPWKIVFNIGREEGTWMPSHWGKSGARLRLEVHCTFTSEKVPQGDTKDPFFAHSHEPVYYISIEEAFAWPTNVGVGRKPLQINPKAGRYQICPGEGPAETDLLRLMIPIPEDLKKDDVTLAAGKVYGTTGYFGHPDQGRQQVIDAVQEEYDSCLAEYHRAERELAEADNFVAWCKAKHFMWNVQQELDEAMDRVKLVHHHYPDHAHMRTDETGNVGLAKEGGLCIQVHTGLAMEYHILGRMEVGHIKH